MDSLNSILTSIKKLLGIAEAYDHFDADIVMHINSVLLTLTQIGVGPVQGFAITDATASWAEFMPETPKFEAVKSYVHLKVRLLFDPPLSTAVIEAMNQNIRELEWRIQMVAEELGTQETR